MVSGLTDTEKGFTTNQYYSTEIRLVPDKSSYHAREPFKAIFRNDFGNTIYVFRSSGISPLMILQKWDGEEWRRVNTSRRGVGGILAVSYHELNPGEVLETQFPAERLVENGVSVPGLYRYILTFYPTPNRDQRIVVTSSQFLVEE